MPVDFSFVWSFISRNHCAFKSISPFHLILPAKEISLRSHCNWHALPPPPFDGFLASSELVHLEYFLTHLRVLVSQPCCHGFTVVFLGVPSSTKTRMFNDQSQGLGTILFSQGKRCVHLSHFCHCMAKKGHGAQSLLDPSPLAPC